jgi:predicted house-cleaning NTP pyrophosphatase (Maf/HAM1 superfamily)
MALWLAAKPLVLASQSKVRRALIEAAGIPGRDPSGASRRARDREPGEGRARPRSR